MSVQVFVDGESGTTGLKIYERLRQRRDIELLQIGSALRKDSKERGKYLNAADIVFLCLPDDAADEAVTLIRNPHTRVIDSSTAHRTAPGWVYGFPELCPGRREEIAKARRVAVPGCHATGFISAVYPLRKGGILSADYPICSQSVSGYSGGGKKLIQKYESGAPELASPRFYALSLRHKHLPEMMKVCSLSSQPLFTPIVADYFSGMLVALPLRRHLLQKPLDAAQVRAFYEEYYRSEPNIRVMPFDDDKSLDEGCLGATALNGTNRLQLFVFGHDDQILVVTRLDNLGKGASGAAVQCMNLMLGLKEDTGLAAVSNQSQEQEKSR